MDFTEDEAEAKKAKQVRVRDDFLSSYGISPGTVGAVVDALPMGSSTARAGQGLRASEKREGWVVEVEFYRPNHKPLTLLLEKDEYETSLEET